jgi:acetyltransferase-like isoleucine patch superfamily enzyme
VTGLSRKAAAVIHRHPTSGERSGLLSPSQLHVADHQPPTTDSPLSPQPRSERSLLLAEPRAVAGPRPLDRKRLASARVLSPQPDSPRPARDVRALLSRARAEPRKAFAAARAIAKGFVFRVYYRAFGRLRAGRNLRVFGWLSIRGPGEVIIGDDVVIEGIVTLWTHAPEARIIIGDRVILGGTAFGCVREIRIGELSILARANIMDTDFHSLSADRRSPEAPVRVSPVSVGRNVWIGDRVGILPGTQIGDNSVVSFGAVCARAYPPNVIIIGNPAKVAAPIPGGGGQERPVAAAGETPRVPA